MCSIAFIAYTLVRHLEYRIRLQYIKLSPEKIRRLLLSVQAAILLDRKTKNRFVLPSNSSSLNIRKIYRLMDAPLHRSVYKICSVQHKKKKPYRIRVFANKWAKAGDIQVWRTDMTYIKVKIDLLFVSRYHLVFRVHYLAAFQTE